MLIKVPLIFVATKLTEILKKQILEGFCSGKSLTSLAKEHGFTPSTISRAVKSFLTEEEYRDLKAKRGKGSPLKATPGESLVDSLEGTVNSPNSLKVDSNQNLEDESLVEESKDSINSSLEDEFMEIAPLSLVPFSEEQKEVACAALEDDSLPQIVYMLIDKKTELEFKPLKDFADWSFLPDEDKSRLAILLYSSQRIAKRNCSRNQRVLKIPDSKVFLISASHLIAKGITRLIIDDSLIALDSINT